MRLSVVVELRYKVLCGKCQVGGLFCTPWDYPCSLLQRFLDMNALEGVSLPYINENGIPEYHEEHVVNR